MVARVRRRTDTTTSANSSAQHAVSHRFRAANAPGIDGTLSPGRKTMRA